MPCFAVSAMNSPINTGSAIASCGATPRRHRQTERLEVVAGCEPDQHLRPLGAGAVPRVFDVSRREDGVARSRFDDLVADPELDSLGKHEKCLVLDAVDVRRHAAVEIGIGLDQHENAFDVVGAHFDVGTMIPEVGEVSGTGTDE